MNWLKDAPENIRAIVAEEVKAAQPSPAKKQTRAKQPSGNFLDRNRGAQTLNARQELIDDITGQDLMGQLKYAISQSVELIEKLLEYMEPYRIQHQTANPTLSRLEAAQLLHRCGLTHLQYNFLQKTLPTELPGLGQVRAAMRDHAADTISVPGVEDGCMIRDLPAMLAAELISADLGDGMSEVVFGADGFTIKDFHNKTKSFTQLGIHFTAHDDLVVDNPLSMHRLKPIAYGQSKEEDSVDGMLTHCNSELKKLPTIEQGTDTFKALSFKQADGTEAPRLLLIIFTADYKYMSLAMGQGAALAASTFPVLWNRAIHRNSLGEPSPIEVTTTLQQLIDNYNCVPLPWVGAAHPERPALEQAMHAANMLPSGLTGNYLKNDHAAYITAARSNQHSLPLLTEIPLIYFIVEPLHARIQLTNAFFKWNEDMTATAFGKTAKEARLEAAGINRPVTGFDGKQALQLLQTCDAWLPQIIPGHPKLSQIISAWRKLQWLLTAYNSIQPDAAQVNSFKVKGLELSSYMQTTFPAPAKPAKPAKPTKSRKKGGKQQPQATLAATPDPLTAIASISQQPDPSALPPSTRSQVDNCCTAAAATAGAEAAAADQPAQQCPQDCSFKTTPYFALLTRVAWNFQERFQGAGRFSTAIIEASNRDWKRYYHGHAPKSGDTAAAQFEGMRMLTSEGSTHLSQQVANNTREKKGHSKKLKGNTCP